MEIKDEHLAWTGGKAIETVGGGGLGGALGAALTRGSDEIRVVLFLTVVLFSILFTIVGALIMNEYKPNNW